MEQKEQLKLFQSAVEQQIKMRAERDELNIKIADNKKYITELEKELEEKKMEKGKCECGHGLNGNSIKKSPLNRETLDRINELVEALTVTKSILDCIGEKDVNVSIANVYVKVKLFRPILIDYREKLKSELKALGYEDE